MLKRVISIVYASTWLHTHTHTDINKPAGSNCAACQSKTGSSPAPAVFCLEVRPKKPSMQTSTNICLVIAPLMSGRMMPQRARLHYRTLTSRHTRCNRIVMLLGSWRFSSSRFQQWLRATITINKAVHWIGLAGNMHMESVCVYCWKGCWYF